MCLLHPCYVNWPLSVKEFVTMNVSPILVLILVMRLHAAFYSFSFSCPSAKTQYTNQKFVYPQSRTLHSLLLNDKLRLPPHGALESYFLSRMFEVWIHDVDLCCNCTVVTSPYIFKHQGLLLKGVKHLRTC